MKTKLDEKDESESPKTSDKRKTFDIHNFNMKTSTVR